VAPPFGARDGGSGQWAAAPVKKPSKREKWKWTPANAVAPPVTSPGHQPNKKSHKKKLGPEQEAELKRVQSFYEAQMGGAPLDLLWFPCRYRLPLPRGFGLTHSSLSSPLPEVSPSQWCLWSQDTKISDRCLRYEGEEEKEGVDAAGAAAATAVALALSQSAVAASRGIAAPLSPEQAAQSQAATLALQAFLPSYLELSLDSFARQNDRLKQQFTTVPPGMGMPGLNPAKALGAVPMPSPQFLEDQVRQNMALFDRAMKMFSPFAYAPVDEPRPAAAPEPAQTAASASGQDPSLGDLKKRIEEMQEQIEKLASKT
jgi:hypothetical protein